MRWDARAPTGIAMRVEAEIDPLNLKKEGRKTARCPRPCVYFVLYQPVLRCVAQWARAVIFVEESMGYATPSNTEQRKKRSPSDC